MNKTLPTISIKGKDYVMVKDRVTAFHEMFPDGSIHTAILSNDEKSVVVKATINTEQGIKGRQFTGHSEAYRGVGQMGQVPVEVAETSAVGRALAMLGIGIIQSVSSGDEINKANITLQKIQSGQNFTADEYEQAQEIDAPMAFEATRQANADYRAANPPVKRNPGVQYGKKATSDRLREAGVPTVNVNDEL